jgi:hypothetical protein
VALPKKKAKLQKFCVEVPLLVPVVIFAADLPTLRKEALDMVRRGDYVFHLGDLSGARRGPGASTKWGVTLAWECPSCNLENWFQLNDAGSCFDYCAYCNTKHIVIPGYSKREEEGCNSCNQRLSCLTIPYAKLKKKEA